MKKRILVWPANTEIGLEIGHAFKGQTHFEVIGASSGPGPADHVFDTHFYGAPVSMEYLDHWIGSQRIHVDAIYPAHDNATLYDGPIEVIGSRLRTATLCRRKSDLYNYLKEQGVNCPEFVRSDIGFFEKPDIGSGSVGASAISHSKNVIMEYLPGPEFTIDCLTDHHGVLRYCQPRTRARIKSGITVETEFAGRPDLVAMGEKINAAMPLRGAWFFQVKERVDGTPVLLEVGCRPAGSSGINRAIGVNLPLLAAYDACGMDIDVMPGKYTVSAFRSLTTHFTTDLEFDTVYCDWDDTVKKGRFYDPKMVALLYQFSNERKCIIFLTKNTGLEPMESKPLAATWVGSIEGKKSEWIPSGPANAIFIDDSHAERKEVHEATGIPVFSPQQAIDLWLK